MAESDDDLEIRNDGYEIKKALFLTTFVRLWHNKFFYFTQKPHSVLQIFLTNAVRVLGVILLIM